MIYSITNKLGYFVFCLPIDNITKFSIDRKEFIYTIAGIKAYLSQTKFNILNDQELDLEKIHKVVFWATEGITGVSASEIEIKSHIQFYNGIKTADIQETLIKSAADLISEETPNYQYVAGRLVTYHLRKQVYGKFQPCHVLELVKKNVAAGFYDKELLEAYNEDEWERINSFIRHDRDEQLTYAAMEQFRGKYLVQNRVTGEIFETPQMAYMLIAATLFQSYPTETRLKWVKD